MTEKKRTLKAGQWIFDIFTSPSAPPAIMSSFAIFWHQCFSKTSSKHHIVKQKARCYKQCYRLNELLIRSCTNSARKSMKIFWAQTFPTQSFFKPSIPGDLRVFWAFASLFLLLSRHTFTHFCVKHFPTDLRIFCQILSWQTFTRFC